MKCTNCGNDLLPGSKFCTNCGAVLNEKEEIEVLDEEPVVTEKKKSHAGLIITICIVGVLVLCLLGVGGVLIAKKVINK